MKVGASSVLTFGTKITSVKSFRMVEGHPVVAWFKKVRVEQHRRSANHSRRWWRIVETVRERRRFRVYIRIT